MLEFVEGKVGSGKSYWSVRRMVAMMAAKRYIVTNIDLKEEGIMRVLRDKWGIKYKSLPYKFLTDDDMLNVYDHVPYGGGKESVSYVVLDEAQNFYNARDWSKLPKQLTRWLSQSRKFGADLVIITQHANNVDTQFRRQGEYFYKLRNLSKMQFPLIGSIPRLMVIKGDQKAGLTHGYKLEKFDDWVFDCYESTAFLDEQTRLLAEGAALVPTDAFDVEQEMKVTSASFAKGLWRVLWGSRKGSAGPRLRVGDPDAATAAESE